MTSNEETEEAREPKGGKPAGGDEQRPEGGTPPASAKRERSTAKILASVALILALIALAGVGVSAWAWYQMRGEQARLSLLEGRTSALEGRVAAMQRSMVRVREIETLQDRLNALQNQVAAEARAARSSSAAYAARLDALSARLANGVTSYREDEVAALLRLAQIQLTVMRDPRASERALKLADRLLAEMQEPRFAPVRAALAKEIQALAAVPQPDIDGAAAQLAALAGHVGALPLAEARLIKPPAAATTAKGWSWRRLGEAFKRAFSPLVVVRHGPLARPLLPPREGWFLRENLRLSLTAARVALLERDETGYRASLDEAQRWLAEWFDPRAPAVIAAQATLSRLAKLALNPPLPTLGAALSALRAIRAGANAS